MRTDQQESLRRWETGEDLRVASAVARYIEEDLEAGGRTEASRDLHAKLMCLGRGHLRRLLRALRLGIAELEKL